MSDRPYLSFPSALPGDGAAGTELVPSPLQSGEAEGRDKTTLCRHFGACGGCAAQDVPYEEQLNRKQDEVLRTVAPFSPGEIMPILPSPDVFYYRNKMEFAFAPGTNGRPVLGLREKGRFDRIVDLEECRLLSPDTGRLLSAVRDWAEEEKLPAYRSKQNRGFLRYLVVREGKNTGERMIRLITTEGNLPRDSFLSALRKSGVGADSVLWSVHSGLSDVAAGELRAVLHGGEAIAETLGGLPFRISSDGFFQTNTAGAERLCSLVADFLGEGVEILFDFYCGSGALGLACAGRAGRLIGIESNPVSVEDARRNAAAQVAGRAEFHAMDAASFLRDPVLVELWGKPGTAAIMDPPRAGIQPPVRRLLLEKPVSRWVYVSCNPKSLARDLPVLSDVYRIDRVRAIDLFPHTPHVETVLALSRRKQ